jgi:hypothetical protein
MLERQGFGTFGMDPVHAKDTARKDPCARSPRPCKTSGRRPPTAASPEEVATWLSDQGLFSVADVLQDATVIAYGSVAEILDRVWTAADVRGAARQDRARTATRRRSTSEPIAWSKVTASSIVLVREEATGRRYRLRTIKVMLGTCDNETCKVIPIDGKARPGAEVYLLHERQDLSSSSSTIASPSSSRPFAPRRSCSRMCGTCCS